MDDYLTYLALNSRPYMPIIGLMIVFVGILAIVLQILLSIFGDTATNKVIDKVTDIDPATDQVTASLYKTTKFIGALTIIGTIVMVLLIVIPTCILTVQYLTPHHTELSDDDVKTPMGYMTYTINNNPVFVDGKSENLGFKNTVGNQDLVQVTIVDDVTGKTIYESPMLQSGQSLQKGTLSTDLAPGTYKTTAHFRCYDPDSKQLMGGLDTNFVEVTVK